MRKHDEDEDWEAEASLAYSQAAESEFSRLKHSLKVKAGLIPLPWYQRALNRFKSLLSRIFFRQ